MTLNRIAGLALAGFGLLLLVWFVPGQTEIVDYGWVRPQTLPNVLAVALIGLGLLQAVVDRGDAALDPRLALQAAAYLGFVALAVWLMGRYGFVWVAPAMVAAVMLALGERRPLWLAVGALALPGLVWLVVVVLLDRTLPG